MSEKEQIVAEATAKAQAEAKKQNLNKAQTKLFVDEAVKKALEEVEGAEETEEVEEVEKTEEKTEEKTKTTSRKNTPQNKTKKAVKTKYIVHTPVPNYVGIVAGVHFAYGKAEVKPGWVLNWFREHGYRVEEVSE